MARNEPSALQIILDETRLLRSDVRIDVGAIRADLKALSERIEEAHDEISNFKNRALGFGAALGLGSGGLGAALAKYWPTLFN